MDLFDFSYEKPKKNIYIGIGISIFILIVIIVCFIVFFRNNKINNTVLTSSDEKFRIEIPSNINYKINSKKDNDFTIDLYSEKDEMYIYATTIEKKRELDLFDVANDDKINYLKDKENIRDDSGVFEISINNNKAYEYNLVYFDNTYGKDFYLDVIWIETKDNIYILNFEVVNDNITKFKDIFSNIKNSFCEL